MKTQLYRLRFEEASVSNAENGRESLSPGNLYPSGTTALASAGRNIAASDFYPALLPFVTNGYDNIHSNPENQVVPKTSPARSNESLPAATQAEVRKMIDERLDGLRIYVLESDITQAQQSVKSVVELASF